MRLTRGMYDSLSCNLFGLTLSQMRDAGDASPTMKKWHRVAKNAGWYNRRGQKLGYGDMSLDDMITIRDGLELGEVFFLLSEDESFWDFVVRTGPSGGLCETDEEKEYAPGFEYAIEHCWWIILPGVIYEIDDSNDNPDEVVRVEDESYTRISRRKVRSVIQDSRHLRVV